MIHTGKHSRTAFTLIEMVLAMLVVSFLVVSLQSVMLLLAKATPSKTGLESPVAAAALATEMLETDLAYASAVTTTGATAIQLTVPDQTGDGQSETIRYEWGGTSGAALVRTYNGQAMNLLTDVREFALTYDRTSVQRATTYSESAEVQLAGYDNLLALSTFVIKDKIGCGQYFLPSLPASATSYRVTRVQIKAAAKAGGAGLTRVELRRAVNQLPTAIVDETTMLESNLGIATSWQTFTFTGCPSIPKNTGMCLVLERISDAEPSQVQYQGLLALVNSSMLSTSDDGATWNSFLTQSLCYYIYGTYLTTDPTVTDYQLNTVRYTLRAGADARQRINGTARVYTRPTVAAP